ncbi:MAG: hypothetical protein QOE61_5887 [Micromonosporaceae bacterium]|jgi:hypothetical protein|nr:hypothetical protein [Micromonosporaceae bacterium]
MPTGLVKSMIQAPGAARRATRCRHVEDHRYRAQSLGQATRAGRLLSNAATLHRERLVGDPGLLAAYAELDEHHVRPVHTVIHLRRPGDPAGMAVPGEQAGAEGADDVEALPGGIDQDQLVDRQNRPKTGKAVRELGRVRRAAANHSDFHPLTPVSSALNEGL